MRSRSTFIESLNASTPNIDPQAFLVDPQQRQELETHWSGLQYLGFELDFTENSLLCNHRENGFNFSIPYGQANSDELRRNLFAELRTCFGSFSDRYLSSLFQPSHQVATLFASFRVFLPICASIDRQQTAL